MPQPLPKKIREYYQILFANRAMRAGSTRLWNKPFYVFLEITNRCNIACIHCGRTHDPRYEDKNHIGDLPLELIQKLKPILPYAWFVIPTGVGEPFLNRDMLPAVRFLKACGTNVSVTSNGTILNDRICQQVIDSGLDKVVFSLDGMQPETYNSIRAGANFDRVVGNIRKLKDLRDKAGSKTPTIEIEMVLMAENFYDLLLLPELAAELGVENVLVETLFEHSGPVYGKILEKQSLTNIDLEEGLRVWQEFLSKARKLQRNIITPLLHRDLTTVFRAPQRPSEIAAPAPNAAPQAGAANDTVPIGLGKRIFNRVFCTQPWSIIYVTWRGEVRTCCFNEMSLGDLRQQSIEEIWNGPAFKQFRKTILNEQVPKGCHDCLHSGSNYNIVPKLEAGLLRKKLRELFDEWIAAIR